jgi:hypothetical protein
MSGNSWGAKHKQALEIAGAAAATAMTMGAAGPAFAGLLGGTVAGTDAAAAGLGAAGGAAGTVPLGVEGAATALAAPTTQSEAALALAEPNPAIPSVSSMFGSPAATLFGTGGGPLGTSPMGANAAFGQATGVNPGMTGAQASMPALGDPLTNYHPGILNQIRGGFTNLVGGPDNKDAILKGVARFNKAGSALQSSGLLGRSQGQGGGGGGGGVTLSQ